MNKYGTRQREYLCLVLQSAEGCRKYQTVVVAFELCTVVMTLGMAMFLPQALV
jgi:hypothetical protein